jgi:hypothetical protein
VVDWTPRLMTRADGGATAELVHVCVQRATPADSAHEPPRVRAMLGASGDQIRTNGAVLDFFHRRSYGVEGSAFRLKSAMPNSSVV